jgi:hydroxyacylglutathione hydrolase
MSLKIFSYVLGPIQNNTYMLANTDSKEAVVIDPALGSELLVEKARQNKFQIKAIWITHGHFDHFAGASVLSRAFTPELPIGIHPDDIDLWRSGGGAYEFGFDVDLSAAPTFFFSHGQQLSLGKYRIDVRHIPGHSRGHVIFYAADAGAALVGDVIFQRSIGRTDLPGGDYDTLVDGIRAHVFTLPPHTRLLPGHGPDTTVEEERQENPYL